MILQRKEGVAILESIGKSGQVKNIRLQKDKNGRAQCRINKIFVWEKRIKLSCTARCVSP